MNDWHELYPDDEFVAERAHRAAQRRRAREQAWEDRHTGATLDAMPDFDTPLEEMTDDDPEH